MPPAIQGILTVAGRVLIALIFLMSAAGNKIPKFSNVVQMTESQDVPIPQVMLVGAIVSLDGKHASDERQSASHTTNNTRRRRGHV